MKLKAWNSGAAPIPAAAPGSGSAQAGLEEWMDAPELRVRVRALEEALRIKVREVEDLCQALKQTRGHRGTRHNLAMMMAEFALMVPDGQAGTPGAHSKACCDSCAQTLRGIVALLR